MPFFNKLKYYLFVKPRILKYKLLSENKTYTNKLKLIYPVLFLGKGKIILNENVQLGYSPSPFYYSTYGHIEARNTNTLIVIGKNVIINNNFSIVALQKIEIQEETVIGTNFSVIDSDFHHLEVTKRKEHYPPAKEVLIAKNVFIGNNVTVLKGVTIGENSVIGNNSVVVKSIPANVIAAGNPARIIKNL